ncbi:cytochrome P450 [Obelidium mucronatum]|nr:cytochrome P450 [Obelidium mucronatum]
MEAAQFINISQMPLFATAIATILVGVVGAFWLFWPRQTKGGPPLAKYGWPFIGHLPIFLGPTKDIPNLLFRGIEGDVVEAKVLGATFYLLRRADAIKNVLGSSSFKTRRSKSDVDTTKILKMHEIGIVLNDHISSWKHSRKLFAEGIGRPRFLKSLAPKLNAKMISVCAKLSELAKVKMSILGNQLLTTISADIITNIVLSDSRDAAEQYIEKSMEYNPNGHSSTDDVVVVMHDFALAWNFFAKTPSLLYNNLPWLKKPLLFNKQQIAKLEDFVLERIRSLQASLESNTHNDTLDGRDLATTVFLSLASSGDSEYAFKHTVACAKEALIGGHDTTRNSMAFLLYELARHPSVCDAIHDEIIQAIGEDNEFTEDAIKKMKLLNAAILEANRIYSLGLMVDRGLEEDLVVNGYTLKRGGQLLFALIWNHHDEAIWEDPLVFNPYRFLQMEPSPGPLGFGYSLAPFGYGMRKCPGQSIAMLEMSVVIGHLVKGFKLHLVDRNLEVKVNEFNLVRECLDFAVQFVSR